VAGPLPILDARRQCPQASDRVPYDVWIRQGFIHATSGNVIDYDVIRECIRTDAEQFRIEEIAFDRWNATQLCTQLASDGIEMMPFGQGFASMAGPTRELEKLIVGRQFAHGGHPVLRWMASNMAVKQDPAGNLKPDKAKSSDRIDGIVALVMAIGRAMVQEENIPYTGLRWSKDSDHTLGIQFRRTAANARRSGAR
jgi:phage terminase large subunit-like protein